MALSVYGLRIAFCYQSFQATLVHPRTLILSCHGDDAKSLLFGDLRLEAEVNHGILEHEAVG